MFRVIPVLLIDQGKLVKTKCFAHPRYVGDPMNAVRIFNEKEVDELILIDITASQRGAPPDLSLIRDIGSEAFVPLGYGGGIQSFEQARAILRGGAEKVILQSAFFDQPDLIKGLVDEFGCQAVVAAIDYRKRWLGGLKVSAERGKKLTAWGVVDFAKYCESLGVGELFLTSIDREGTGTGYDLETLVQVTRQVSIPVVVHGGAKGENDFIAARQAGAAAAAAGSCFVFHGELQSVLISYLDRQRHSAVWE